MMALLTLLDCWNVLRSLGLPAASASYDEYEDDEDYDDLIEEPPTTRELVLEHARHLADMAHLAAQADQFVVCGCGASRRGHPAGFFPLISTRSYPPLVVALICESCAEPVLLSNGRLVTQ